MFKCIGGDFPKGTGYTGGLLVWGFGSDKKLELKGNIENIEVITSGKKEVNFICYLKDGRKFVGISDHKTFQNIQVAKISENRQTIQNKSVIPKKQNNKIVAIASIILILCLAIGIGINNKNGSNPENRVFKSFGNITETQMEKIQTVLLDCGIENISDINLDTSLEWEGLDGFRVDCERGEVQVYLKDGDIKQVRYLGKYLYQSGKQEASIKDYTLTISEETELQIYCQNTIKDILKSPSTAKFPGYSDWYFEKNKNKTIVQSYVDAQNGFGAMIRSEYQFTIVEGTLKSLIFDGVEYIK